MLEDTRNKKQHRKYRNSQDGRHEEEGVRSEEERQTETEGFVWVCGHPQQEAQGH